MSRTILDRKAQEVGNIPLERQQKIEKILDRLNIPKNGSVQLNVGKVERLAPNK